MSISAPPRTSIRFRGRSFLALVLAPEAPLEQWLEQFDAWAAQSPGFFVGRPVVLDVTGLGLDKPALAKLVSDLHDRSVRLMGIEGSDPSTCGLGLPPSLSGGRSTGVADVLDAQAAAAAPAPAVARKQGDALVIEGAVRSGQVIIHPEGDVIVAGSVGSGAEIVAGGSIHVYGTLRGRAIAGTTGAAKSRIFCKKFEAELVAIDGLYKTADAMKPELRSRAVQAWLEGDAIIMAAMD
ncbi:septum site-determining protein MinC [Alsobacter soli]|uniref:septum site-determining protein MinC n=1 Tax=Alsobacter soli TaxID=2109933 RepID=UPI0018AD47C9|nr:septum site-determining protein MinC [Alsobacter soli]